jgi:mannose-6-phosphate isomerase
MEMDIIMLKPQPYILKNTVQHYEWGTKGKNAFIPKLLNIKPERDKPYAELWMGAHPKASSKIFIDGKEFDLAEVIRKYPSEMLGRKTAKRFSNTLPFLFKVLSVNEALSIQVHPNKKQAKALHKKDPLNYPDENQKHEIAIALDSLTALIGFKPIKQIMKTLKDYPEIIDFIGAGIKIDPIKKNFVKQIFTQLIKNSITDTNRLSSAIKKLNDRLDRKKVKTEIEKYFLKLHKKYKTNVGLLILFFLNLVKLKRGEAIFTKPGVPHAYLKGNILECMSNSDNVIRAGLTPKFKDLKTLLKVLSFEPGSPEILKGQKKKDQMGYKINVKEFVIRLFKAGKTELEFNAQSGPRILLVLNGKIKLIYKVNDKFAWQRFAKGDSLFLPSILSKYKITSEKSTSFVLVEVP